MRTKPNQGRLRNLQTRAKGNLKAADLANRERYATATSGYLIVWAEAVVKRSAGWPEDKGRKKDKNAA